MDSNSHLKLILTNSVLGKPPQPATNMRLLTLASAVLSVLPLITANTHSAQIYIQPVGSGATTPVPLAEVTYDLSAPDTQAMVTSYEAPELPESATLVRIGLYDARAKDWVGSTSVASVRNFGKGYSPHFLLTVSTTAPRSEGEVDEEVSVLGVSLRGVRIDAGQTRDFGPQAKLVVAGQGKQPELNKPVVLSPDGKKLEKEPEKTFLQKFVLFPTPENVVSVTEHCADLSLQILVDDRHCCPFGHGWRRRRRQVILTTTTYLMRLSWHRDLVGLRGIRGIFELRSSTVPSHRFHLSTSCGKQLKPKLEVEASGENQAAILYRLINLSSLQFAFREAAEVTLVAFAMVSRQTEPGKRPDPCTR